MLFNSIDFLIFLLAAWLLYCVTNNRHKWVILLLGSYFFYAYWKFEYLFLIIISTLIDYFIAIRIHQSKDEKLRKFLLTTSIVANIGLLFCFKYFNFFSTSISDILNWVSYEHEPLFLNVLLPVGISFYTFQTISYTIDVYNGKCQPEKHLGIYALYVTFFPQLVAGPIERASRLLPQLLSFSSPKYPDVISGLRLILFGFFKKLVIADRIAVYVNEVFMNYPEYANFQIVLAVLFFTIQIYCDFSGYSDIAIGTARLFGVKLMTNFNAPYLSRSLGEFWQRWHISLSTWFRDYVYIPLGGNKVKINRWRLNLLFTFLISGLWHGANWPFIIWGAIHGTFILIEKTILDSQPKGFLKKLFPNYLTTMTLVVFSWIFFRSESLGAAFELMERALDFQSFHFSVYGFSRANLIISGIFITVLLSIDLILKDSTLDDVLSKRSPVQRILIYGLFGNLILFFGMYAEESKFIYFQF